MIVAPGAIDCITGRAIAQAGFSAAYMTGAGTSATLGYPDYGLITMTEMVANASRIANSIDIPLISDSDTGYGNELNVFRTVQEFERAGVAAIHIEDQVFPQELRPSRQQGAGQPRGLRRQDPRRGGRPQVAGFLHHRPHRFAGGGRPRRGDRARQRRAGQRRRRGLRRGAADDGRGRGGAEAGEGALPAQHGARRQDAGSRRSTTPRAWVTPSRSCPACCWAASSRSATDCSPS